MINFAKASLYHWRKSDKYGIMNEQRGQWLISHVYAILNKFDEALSHAKETLRLTEENDFKDFDLTYSFEALARANAAAGTKECTKWLRKAQEAGTFIAREQDRKIFIADLDSLPWFGYK